MIQEFKFYETAEKEYDFSFRKGFASWLSEEGVRCATSGWNKKEWEGDQLFIYEYLDGVWSGSFHPIQSDLAYVLRQIKKSIKKQETKQALAYLSTKTPHCSEDILFFSDTAAGQGTYLAYVPMREPGLYEVYTTSDKVFTKKESIFRGIRALSTRDYQKMNRTTEDNGKVEAKVIEKELASVPEPLESISLPNRPSESEIMLALEPSNQLEGDLNEDFLFIEEEPKTYYQVEEHTRGKQIPLATKLTTFEEGLSRLEQEAERALKEINKDDKKDHVFYLFEHTGKEETLIRRIPLDVFETDRFRHLLSLHAQDQVISSMAITKLQEKYCIDHILDLEALIWDFELGFLMVQQGKDHSYYYCNVAPKQQWAIRLSDGILIDHDYNTLFERSE